MKIRVIDIRCTNFGDDFLYALSESKGLRKL
jgi:hypothetical protein